MKVTKVFLSLSEHSLDSWRKRAKWGRQKRTHEQGIKLRALCSFSSQSKSLEQTTVVNFKGAATPLMTHPEKFNLNFQVRNPY